MGLDQRQQELNKDVQGHQSWKPVTIRYSRYRNVWEKQNSVSVLEKGINFRVYSFLKVKNSRKLMLSDIDEIKVCSL